MEIKIDKEAAAAITETCDRLLKGQPPVAGSANCYDADLKAALQVVLDAKSALQKGSGLKVPVVAACSIITACHALDDAEYHIRSAS